MFPLNSTGGQNPVRGRILGYRMETGHQEKEEGKNEVGDLAKTVFKVTMFALSHYSETLLFTVLLVFRSFSLYLVTRITSK